MPEGALPILNFFKPEGIPYAILLLALVVVLARLVTTTAERFGNRFADRRLAIQQVGSLARFAIYLGGIASIVATLFRLSEQLLLAVGGTLAVAIGFATKDLASSVLAGVIILVDRPFQVGDRVTFDGWYGEIRHIGLRSVRLLTLDDTQVTIPNNKFLTEVVASGNAGAVDMMVQVDLFVRPDQDLTRARELTTEALVSSRYIHPGRRWAVSTTEVPIGDIVTVRLRAKAYVMDVQYETAFATDVTERSLEAFRQAGILAAGSESSSPAGSPGERLGAIATD